MTTEMCMYSVLERINVAVLGLNLPPQVIGLLFSLSHGLSIALGWIGQVCKLTEKTQRWSVVCIAVLNFLTYRGVTHLGLVPLLRFLHVFGGNALILSSDVSKCCGQIRAAGCLHHLHLHLLILNTHLYILNFLHILKNTCNYLNVCVFILKEKSIYFWYLEPTKLNIEKK